MKRRSFYHFSSKFFALLLLFLMISPIFGKSFKDEEVRAIWVTRWDYKNHKDVWKIINNCKNYGFNLIFFQVRGNATVFYASRLEPWAYELTSNTPETLGKNPGWDPLGTAMYYARRVGISVHPYINVLPGWRGNGLPPKRSPQIYNRYRKWFMMDTNGKYMKPEGQQYAYLNPALPEVRKHIVRVVAELVRRYQPEGIHLDYFRYPYDCGDYSFDPYSVSAFKKIYGFKPKQGDPEWALWRSNQNTTLMRAIYATAKQNKPDITISAAVIANYKDAKECACQPSQQWLKSGILDMAVPMIYVEKLENFDKFARDFKRNSGGKPIVAGLYLKRGEEMIAQKFKMARKLNLAGTCAFSYSAIFPNHQASNWARMFKNDFKRKSWWKPWKKK